MQEDSSFATYKWQRLCCYDLCLEIVHRRLLRVGAPIDISVVCLDRHDKCIVRHAHFMQCLMTSDCPLCTLRIVMLIMVAGSASYTVPTYTIDIAMFMFNLCFSVYCLCFKLLYDDIETNYHVCIGNSIVLAIIFKIKYSFIKSYRFSRIYSDQSLAGKKIF